ncbi:hypothetical protein AB0D33_36200 [Streptomyces sp. NPDC048404]|uniref:hypothetical protein n=1 Tax=unclassified Streptomyces TaxID=2593676 RepID=UPI00343DDC13
MTLAPQPVVGVGAAPIVADDEYVLPKHLTSKATGRGPRFGEMVWDLRPFVVRTTTHARLDFSSGFADEVAVRTAKECLFSRFRRGIPASYVSASRVKPLKLTGAAQAMHRLRTVLADLRAVGAPRLTQVRRDHLVAVLDRWKTGSVETAACLVTALKQLSAHGPFLSWDRLMIHPWPGRPAAAVVGRPPRSKENSTERIPEHIMAPYLRGAVFYVTTASKDILAGHRVLEDLRAAAERKPYAYGRGRAMFAALVAERGAAGRGLPALPLEMAHLRPDAPVVGGVVQAPNVTFIELLIGGYGADPGLRRMIDDAGDELGYEPGGLDSPISPWPESGLPWRPRLDPFSVKTELQYLRTACWAVIAYLSGMRDAEVRELSRDCAFTEPGDDGRLRHKIRGRVYKHRKLSGDEAEWVVLEIVHQAVEVLRAINNCPQYLFGWGSRETGFGLMRAIPGRLRRFRDHLNDLFGTDEGLFVPNDTSAVELDDDPDADDPDSEEGAGTGEEAAEDGEGVPWAFTTVQFRRTVAWHIAHQPFGVVAGTRQYQHTRTVMFEGYAGTSESGFAAEVASNEAAARLDYLEDLYRDWNDGGASSGGATERISAEFERIRRELGDLPGVVSSSARLRTMLQHLTETLHPGVLNDCFFQAATAICRKRAKVLGRPVPLHNMCLHCPNARRSAVHLPRLTTARNQAVSVLDLPKKEREALPRLQVIALTDYATELDELIQSITTDDSTEGTGAA